MNRSLLMLLLLGSSAVVANGFHGWYDDSGHLHISNVPAEFLNRDGTIRPEWHYRDFADPEFLARQREKATAAARRRLEARRENQERRSSAIRQRGRTTRIVIDAAAEEELSELQTRLQREESLLFVMEADQRRKVPRYYAEDVTNQQEIVQSVRDEIAAVEQKIQAAR